MRCLEKYDKQWRPKQEKSGWQKQKEEETKRVRAEEERKKKKKKKLKKERIMEVNKVVEKWKI